MSKEAPWYERVCTVHSRLGMGSRPDRSYERERDCEEDWGLGEEKKKNFARPNGRRWARRHGALRVALGVTCVTVFYIPGRGCNIRDVANYEVLVRGSYLDGFHS